MDVDLVKRLRFGSLTTMGAHRMNLEAAEEITRLRAQLAAAEADKLAAMERVREAAAKACICTIAERRIDNSLEHERRIEARIRALDLDALAEGEK